MDRKEALVIWVEACDCGGKTTAIKKMYDYFTEKMRLKVLCLKEPGGENSYPKQAIRKLLLDPKEQHEPLNDLSRKFLFSVDHIETLKQIKENKDEYDVILVDRSSLITNLMYSFEIDNYDNDKSVAEECFDIQYRINALAMKHLGLNKENHFLALLRVEEKEFKKRFKMRCDLGVDKTIYDDSNMFAHASRVRSEYEKFAGLMKSPSFSKNPLMNKLFFDLDAPFKIGITSTTCNTDMDDLIESILFQSNLKPRRDKDAQIVVSSVEYCLKSVPRLLKAKGFECTPKDYVERLVLLQTEVSELADAVKKGKGDIEEGNEVADIAIRLFNLTAMYGDVLEEKIKLYAYNLGKIESIIHSKYGVCKYLHDTIFRIGEVLDKTPIYKDTIKDNWNMMCHEDFDKITHYMMSMMCMLSCYCDKFLSSTGKNLFDFVIEKMEYNFSRPYKYNTSEEDKE